MSPSRDFECVRTHIRISELFTIYLFIEHYIKWKKFQDSSPFVRYNKRLSQQCFLGLTKCTVTIIEVINYILFVGLFLAYRLLLVSLTVYLTSLLLLFFCSYQRDTKIKLNIGASADGLFIDTTTGYHWAAWTTWGTCQGTSCPDSNIGTHTRTRGCFANATSTLHQHCGTDYRQTANCTATCPSKYLVLCSYSQG